MRSAAIEPFEPGFVAEGLARLFPLSAQMDEHAMQAFGSLVGYFCRAAGFKVD